MNGAHDGAEGGGNSRCVAWAPTGHETAEAADGGLKGAAAVAPAVVSAIAPPADSSAATPTAAGAS